MLLAVPLAQAQPLSATRAPAGPLAQVVFEPGEQANTLLAYQLRRVAGDKGGGVAADGWAATLAALSQQPRVAVVRYDALQAARRDAVGRPASPALPALQVVAPLTLEPVYFVVRADAPWSFVHQLDGKAINTGPPQGSRALTADTLYRQLFGSALRASPARDLDEAAALQQLRSGKDGLEAVVLVGARAVAWSPADAAGFKLLRLDPVHPASRKLTASFLPTPLVAPPGMASPGGEATTPAVMSFLVTARAPPAGQPAHDRAMAALARQVCQQQQALRQGPGQLWQRVPPDLRPEVGWPYSAPAQAELARCTSGEPRPRSARRTAS